MTNGSVKTVVFSVLAMILSVEECTSDPRINAVNKSCHSLTVQWTAREGVDKYQVQYRPITQTKGWQNKFTNGTIFEITDLLPNTTYTVRIKNATGGSKALVTSGDFTLLPDTGSISINEVRLTGDSIRFKLSGSTRQYRCWTTPHDKEGRNETTVDPGGSGVFSGLQPNINYTIDCEGNNHCYVSRTRISIRISAPDKVDAVVVDGLGRVDGDQIHQSISWRRPHHHTSQLHYTIKYGPSSVVDRPTHPSVNTTTSSNTTVILTLPIPTTPVVYNVWVAAVSDVGQGEYRMTHFNYKEPSPPENITVINETCNSLSVQWSPPSDTGGLAITGYTVGMVNNISSETNVTYTSDTEVQIRVTNILGASRPASATYARNNGYCSGQQLAEPELNLMITLPQSKDSINYSCTLSPGNQTIVTSSGDITLTDLSPNTAFSVRCFVCENREDLCYEENKSSDESSESCPSDNASILLNVGLFLAGLINGTVGTLLAGVPIYILCKKCIFERRKRNISESNYSLGDYSPGDYSVDSESTQLHVYASVDKENKGSSERYVNISRKSSRTVEEEVYDNIDDVKMEINEAYSDSLRLSANYL